MKTLRNAWMLIMGATLSALAFAQGPDHMGDDVMRDGMMHGTGIFMMILWLLLIVLLVLGILAVIKYLRQK